MKKQKKSVRKAALRIGELGVGTLYDAEYDRGDLSKKQADAARAVLSAILLNVGHWLYYGDYPGKNEVDLLLGFTYDMVRLGIKTMRDDFEGCTVKDVYRKLGEPDDSFAKIQIDNLDELHDFLEAMAMVVGTDSE